MVTSDLQIKFIEVNNYPLWPRGTDFLNNMIQKMGVRKIARWRWVVVLIQLFLVVFLE